MKLLDYLTKLIMLAVLLFLFMFITELDKGLKEKYRPVSQPAKEAPPTGARRKPAGE